MVRRKTMKKRAKKLRTRSMRSRTMRSRTMRGRRKIKNTKRKMRGGRDKVRELIHKYDPDIQEVDPTKQILKICLLACDALQPFIQTVYEILNKLTTEYQDDADLMSIMTKKTSATDVFTIADGMVQHILRKYLFNDPENNKDFVGEEQVVVQEKNEVNEKYIINNTIVIPSTFTPLIDQAIEKIKLLGKEIPEYIFQKYTIFVDPIDGTAEFSGTDKRTEEDREKDPWPIGGKGDQCTILIGFADKKGKAVAGLAYRPVINPKNTKNTYAYGWIDEEGKGHVNDFQRHLNMSDVESDPTTIRFITSNGAISNITSELIEKIGERIPSGGAGNKILMLLENKGDVYLQDRGVSRWDTCAGDAILEAYGGRLALLTNFLENDGNIDERYIYKKLTAEGKNTNENPAATITGYTNQYSNLCGLFAIKNKEDQRISEIYKAIVKVAGEHEAKDAARVEKQEEENNNKKKEGNKLTKEEEKNAKTDIIQKDKDYPEFKFFHFD